MKNILNKLFNRHIFLIKLQENNLTLTHAKKKLLSDSIYIINVSEVNLEPTHFKNGIIYKPSSIQCMISDYFKTEKLSKPKTFINIPQLSQKSDLMLDLAIFQAALCIGKTGAKICNITNSDFLNKHNYLELLGNKNIKSPYPWLTCTITSILILLTWINKMRLESSTQINFLNKNIYDMQKTSDTLRLNVKNFAQIKKSNEQLKIAISKTTQTALQEQNPLNHILEISSKTPEHTYLTCLNFKKKLLENPTKAKNINIKKLNSIEIEGIATNAQSANQLIRKLALNTKLFKNLDLDHIKSIKNPKPKKRSSKNSKTRGKNSHRKYQFRASGTLNYIC